MTPINFTNEVATVSAGSNGSMTPYKAELATVSVTGTSISGTSTITVGPAAANKLLSGPNEVLSNLPVAVAVR